MSLALESIERMTIQCDNADSDNTLIVNQLHMQRGDPS